MRTRALWLQAVFLVGLGCVCGKATIISGNQDGGPDTSIDAGCEEYAPCEDGGVCVLGACCAASSVCGSACCGGQELCSFDRCVAPGASCRESADCSSTEFCDFTVPSSQDSGTNDAGASIDAGVCLLAPAAPGRCLPRPPLCPESDGGSPPGAGKSCVEACRFVPGSGVFSPSLKYAWGGMTAPPYETDIMMSPIVTQLDDDDCDGKVTANDMPDLLFVTFASGGYTGLGTLHALTVRNGALEEKWSVAGTVHASTELAAGDLDGLPGSEVVGCAPDATAFRPDGTVLWTSAGNNCRMPALADLDADGHPEVVTEYAVLDGLTGARLHAFARNLWGHFVADVTGDGTPEIVSGAVALNRDGTVLADSRLAASLGALADLDLDGQPEIVGVDSSSHTLFIWRYDATRPDQSLVLRQGVDINATLDPTRCPPGSGGATNGGGPPTIGDFNGDGTPDVALAGGVGYAVFDGKKLLDPSVPAAETLLWAKPTQDCSSAATGSSLFDFDGDGHTEVVYGDETTLHVYDSSTGDDLWSTCNTSGTLYEYPVVADVDNDAQADLVVVSNAYAYACADGTKTAGLRVFSSDDWVVTRRIWNQHAYCVTNVEEDGTIPSAPKINWLTPGLNNFRQQKQPGLEFTAADAVIFVERVCSVGGAVRLTVRNLGEAQLPPGATAELLKGAPPTGTLLGSVVTTRTLGPAQSETFSITVTDAEVLEGRATIYGQITSAGARECRTGNNTSEVGPLVCVN